MKKINWINGQAGGTPLSAENLNQMQDNIEDAIAENLNQMQDNIEDAINEKISDNLQSLVASSVEEMTDTTRVYVNTNDGHWYWNDGSNWIDGGVYQATEISDGSVSPQKTTFFDFITTNLISFISNTIDTFKYGYDEENEIYTIDGAKPSSTVRKIIGSFETGDNTEFCLKAFKIEDTNTKPTIYVMDNNDCNTSDGILYTYSAASWGKAEITLEKNKTYYIQMYTTNNVEVHHKFRLKVEEASIATDDYVLCKKYIKEEYIYLQPDLGLKGKKLSICGVSVDTYAGYIPDENTTYYSSNNLASVENTWWKKLLNETGMDLLINNSWSGATATTTKNLDSSGIQRCISLHAGVNTPDFIVIGAFALNDWLNSEIGEYTIGMTLPDIDVDLTDSSQYETYKSVVENYSTAMATMFYRIQQKYPNAKLFVMDSYNYYRNGTALTYAGSKSISACNNALYNVAEAFGVEVIKLSECGITSLNSRNYCVEGTSATVALHPNDEGHTMLYREVLEHFKKYM